MDVKTLDQMIRDRAIETFRSELVDKIEAVTGAMDIYAKTVPGLKLETNLDKAPSIYVVLDLVKRAIMASEAPAVGQKAVEDFLAKHEDLAAEVKAHKPAKEA
jgi:hypothetical protein